MMLSSCWSAPAAAGTSNSWWWPQNWCSWPIARSRGSTWTGLSGPSSSTGGRTTPEDAAPVSAGSRYDGQRCAGKSGRHGFAEPGFKDAFMNSTPPTPNRNRFFGSTVFARGSYAEALRIGEILRKETVGGALLVAAAVLALIWANSPASDSYFALRDFKVGYEPWHLQLSLGAWAADGLLAIFFFLVGLELKREFVAGDLRQISKSIVPVAAAVGGVAVPAVIYAVVNLSSPDTLRGWAIPTATDIAFAVAVLAIIGSHLPSALRIFLLTLAVVDDLIAITIIAIFYTEEIHVPALLLALIPMAAYGFLAQKYRRFFGLRPAAAWLILLPIGIVAWALVHASGIHATVAGVVLGFTIPVLRSQAGGGPEAG